MNNHRDYIKYIFYLWIFVNRKIIFIYLSFFFQIIKKFENKNLHKTAQHWKIKKGLQKNILKSCYQVGSEN